MELTKTAAEKLHVILIEQQAAGIRIFQAAEGCCGPQIGFSLDPAMEQDEILELQGIQVAIDSLVKDAVQHVVIDYTSDDTGEGFVMIGAPTGDC